MIWRWLEALLDWLDPEEPVSHEPLQPSGCPCGLAWPHTHFGDGR